jgi:hypothetical protein
LLYFRRFLNATLFPGATVFAEMPVLAGCLGQATLPQLGLSVGVETSPATVNQIRLFRSGISIPVRVFFLYSKPALCRILNIALHYRKPSKMALLMIFFVISRKD